MLGRLFRRSPEAKSTAALKDVKFGCRRLLSEAGAANSAAIAGEVIRLWPALGETSRVAFFQFLDSLAPERERVLRAARAYAENSTPEHLLELQDAVEPLRQELLRRINRTSGGVAVIVAMRRALVGILREHPELRAVDADFSHVLASWFNPGFLDLQRVDWNSPAALLEKIIQHEAADLRECIRRKESK